VQAYGIIHLLQCRSIVTDDQAEKPQAIDHIKFLRNLPANLASNGPLRSREGGSTALVAKGTDEASRPAHSGSVAHTTATELMPDLTQVGSWWRVCSSVIVREDMFLESLALRHAVPGNYLQQGGPAERFVSGKRHGIIRMPILPNGWVTIDATAAGGPRYLEHVPAPRWRVVYDSGADSGDVLLRAGVDLDSREVAMLRRGTVVEQARPLELLGTGVLRMPVTVLLDGWTAPAASQDWANDGVSCGEAMAVTGWVTVDATAAGGPIFFEEVCP